MTDDSPRVSASALDSVDGGAALAASIRELASAIRALAERAPRDPDALLTAEDVEGPGRGWSVPASPVRQALPVQPGGRRGDRAAD